MATEINNEPQVTHKWYSNIKYLLVGVLFGIVFVKSEVVVGAISGWLIKRYKIKTISVEPIIFKTKEFNKGQIYAGLIFGLGWGLTGACPGPLFAQIGMGALVVIVILLSAIAGTWVYGKFRDSLPH